MYMVATIYFFFLYFAIFYNHIRGLIIGVFTSNFVDRGFESRSDQML
jgi:hypothetical protein